MKLTYQTYVAQMRGFRQTPMSQTDFNKMQGIHDQVEIPVFIARKSSSAKEVKPTLDAHINLKVKL